MLQSLTQENVGDITKNMVLYHDLVLFSEDSNVHRFGNLVKRVVNTLDTWNDPGSTNQSTVQGAFLSH